MDAMPPNLGRPPGQADLNEIVAYNFRAARELRGWTQEETARALERLLGQRLPQASISAIERPKATASVCVRGTLWYARTVFPDSGLATTPKISQHASSGSASVTGRQ